MSGNGKYALSSLVTVMIILLSGSCVRFTGNGYSSSWEKYPDGRWAGPDLWANRLADWEIKDSRLTCTANMPLRTVHLVTRRIGPGDGDLMSLVNIRRHVAGTESHLSSAGILAGAGGSLDYRAACLVFHSWGEGAGLYIGIDGKGRVFIRDLDKENEFPAYAESGLAGWKETILKITAVKSGNGTALLDVIAVDPSSRRVISELTGIPVASERLKGNIALVADQGNQETGRTSYSFSHWQVRGSRVESQREHNIGPLVTAQYTLSRETLKMTAQLMPVDRKVCDTVDLQFIDEDKWQTVAKASVDTPSYTASFRVNGYSGSTDRRYRLIARYKYGSDAVNSLTGLIKHDPVEKDNLKLLSLSCIEQVIKPDPKRWAGIDAGYFPFEWAILFPHSRMTENLKKQKPDILFFAGDQVYEGASPTAAVFGKGAIEDYLYKWYMWCITYRDLTTTIPSITIPDDHDVYQGNLWGCGGRATPPGLEGSAAQDAGGYRMSARFVNLVQKTQTSHLPDPADPEPADQGIGVYFTDCNIGGISMAVIEDRKFKSAPAELLPAAQIINGWPQNQRWNPKWLADVPKATLLGDRQYSFLETWATDWSEGAWMKAVLSQTLWANLSTLPDSAMSDAIVPLLEIPDSGVYVTGDKIISDFDSDGWPQSGRNRALKIIRKAFAIHICGDQHLPSTVHYGTDTWNDAGYAVVSPATGNIFPRRWFPPVPGRNRAEGAPDYTGEFEDGFGNKITVCAVANPHKSKVYPSRQNDLVTGYSAVTFTRSTREIELANWPEYADPLKDKPFPGWPIKISQADNYGRRIIAWLPEVVTEGLSDPVIRIISENTGEIVYNMRIRGNSYQPGVFFYGSYTIEAGDPDMGVWKKAEGIQAWTTKERQKILLTF
jgi:alkaline phosphatase D